MKVKKTSRQDAAIAGFARRCFASLHKQQRDYKAYSDDLARIIRLELYPAFQRFSSAEISALLDAAKAAATKARESGEEYVPVVISERDDEEEEEDDAEEEEDSIVWYDEPDTGHGPWGSVGENIMCGIAIVALLVVLIWLVK